MLHRHAPGVRISVQIWEKWLVISWYWVVLPAGSCRQVFMTICVSIITVSRRRRLESRVPSQMTFCVRFRYKTTVWMEVAAMDHCVLVEARFLLSSIRTFHLWFYSFVTSQTWERVWRAGWARSALSDWVRGRDRPHPAIDAATENII